MNKITVSAIIGVIIIAFAAWYFSTVQSAPAPQSDATAEQMPSRAAGINGSPNQGNLGGPDTGTVQQPGDGTPVGQNLALGITSNASIGQYLTAYNGMAVYTFAKDKTGTTTCYNQCAAKWPPYTVPAGSALNLQAGVTGSIGTITRADGTSQVTYNGMPLYYYAGDKTTTDVTGQGVGNVWFVGKP